MNKVFSIIIVTYNAEATLERTLMSVSGQSARSEIELIVVDGASKDGTMEVVRRFDGSVDCCVSEPDSGLYDAMNKAMEMASGAYLWFVNAGDAIHTLTIASELIDKIRETSPDIIYGETALVDNEGRFLRMRRLRAPEKLHWKSFKNGMMVCHQSFIVRRELAPKYDLGFRFSSDVDWCIRCMKASEKIVNSGMILSDYLVEGLSTGNRRKSLVERFIIQSRHYGLLQPLLRHFWFAIRFAVARLRGRC